MVTTSSSGAYFEGLHYETFGDSPERRKLGRHGLYYQSKLVSPSNPNEGGSRPNLVVVSEGNAMVAHEAAKRYADKKILSFACNPGTSI